MTRKKKSHCLLKTMVSLMLAAVISLSSAIPANAAALGIDVSKYQGAINWGAVPSSGVSYTFIKVGSTKSGVDPAFAANVAGAQAAGLRTGVYIYSYANSVEAAVNEANLVLQWIEGYHINFPVAFDVEDSVYKKLDPATVTAMANAFCDVIASAGYHPIVYTGTNFYRKHFAPGLRYDIWIAQYGDSCDIPGHAIWQASQTGSVAGVAGHVDIDYMYKDYHNLIIPVGFAQRGEGTYFYNDYRIQFGWVDYNNARYHMDATGRMNTGWFTDESGTYYLADDGHALVGQNQLGEDRFYFDEAGRIHGGWITVADNQYYYDANNGCRMVTGWFNDETGRHYLYPADGHLVKGALTIEGKDYLFNTAGSMLTDWQEVNGLRFYYNPADGAMVKGWLGDIANRYYLTPVDGHMVTGWQNIENANYYFNENGLMQIGMVKIGDATFYFDPNTGMQQTGFIGDMTNRYYFNTVDGRMVTGLQNIDGQLYLFDQNGKMMVGWQNIDGTTFYFSPADGSMVKGLIPQADGVYGTSETDGHRLVNEVAVIGGVPRCFDANGRVVANAPFAIGDAVYSCDANGIATLVTPPAAPAAAQ
ncbi:MAG: hypothetical protein HFI07_12330 [Lachnospiraceae bacterium]|jgi:glucan-binding YG repeat protein|nr:hypothetical protein [Lachnospiraceae bacterium]